ncbi:hypothetical protein RJT34_05321 [Clitoria ternatea]|uniref:Late embryogenesis abundant protein LEA-2 subgroup domain-containing protein n=1 Tax=Clitoria ternatea TaxID=43366 RepID=A0AAN9PTK7_CLITE
MPQEVMPLPTPATMPIHTHTTKTTTEDLIAMFSIRQQRKQSSKFFVYIFASFVTLFALFTLFASIVLRVTNPQIEFISATFMHVHHANITMFARVTLTNPNFGPFHYNNTTVAVSNVGARKLQGGRVEARETKKIDFVVNLRFHKPFNLSSDVMKLRSYAKLSGTVHVLKFVKRRKITVMACIMNLNLTSYSVHQILC